MGYPSLVPPVQPELMIQLSEMFSERLDRGSPEGVRYKKTGPIRFVHLRSRQTIDVSAYTSPEQETEMFREKDAGASDATGIDVLTPEPLLKYGVGLSSGYALGIYAMCFETNSADLSTANSRLVQRSMRGAISRIDRTNRTILGPYPVNLSGDPVNREDLTSGTGAAAVDAGVVQPDLLTISQPNPLVIWPRDEIKPVIKYDGSLFATNSLTADFQVIQTLFAMVADVEPKGGR